MTEPKDQEQMGKTFTSKVRIFEAACGIEFPNAEEQNFRVAMMKCIARDLGLAELKPLVLTGNGQGRERPKVGPGSR